MPAYPLRADGDSHPQRVTRPACRRRSVPLSATARSAPAGRRASLLAAFGLITAAALLAPLLAPAPRQREPFGLPGDPVFDALERAGRELPLAGVPVFLFVAGESPERSGNVLDLAVLRELCRRHDLLLADPLLGPLFPARPNPFVGRDTRGPWSLAETVRAAMDGDSLMPWDGPGFDDAAPADLDRLLDRLLAFTLPGPAGPLQPYRLLLSEDLARDDAGHWSAGGMILPAAGGGAEVAAAVADGRLAGREAFEAAVDAVYAPPLRPATGQAVKVWSYAALESQIDAQVAASLPLVGAGFLVVLALAALFLRDGADILAVAVGQAVLVAWMAGFRIWSGMPETQLSAILPILMLALGVDFAIHSLWRWREILAAGPTAPDAARRADAAFEAVRLLRPALGLAAATTIIAFGTGLVSGIPDLREWALQAIFALVSAYLVMGVLVPHLRALMTAPRPRRGGDRRPWRPAWSRALARLHARHPGRVTLIFLLVLAAGLLMGRPEAGFDVRDYVAADSRFVASLDMERAAFRHSGEPNFLLVEGPLDGDEALERLGQAQADIREAGLAIRQGLAPPSLADLRGGPGPSPRMRQAVAIVSPWLDAAMHNGGDGPPTMARLWFNAAEPDDLNAMNALRDRLRSMTRDLADLPGIRVTVTGPGFARMAYVDELTRDFAAGNTLAYGLCGLVLLAALGSLRLALITLLPVVAVASWLQAAMARLDIGLNIVTVQVTSLALGLGLDYAIHLVQRLRQDAAERRDESLADLLEDALAETGTALTASATTTAAGFLVLTLAPMPLFTTFGFLMALTIVLALAAALGGLPGLILKLARLGPAASQ